MKKLLIVCAVLMFVFVSAPDARADMKKERILVCAKILKGTGASKDLIGNICKSYGNSKHKFLTPEVRKFMKTRTLHTAYCGWVRDLLAGWGQLSDRNMWGTGCAPAHLSDGQIGRHGRSYGN